jgi:hypothetical protein
MQSRLDLGFEAQQRNRPRLRPAVLATMRPALDSAGHRVPRTKPTCLLHTWRPHRRRPFALVLHLDQHQSSRNLHLQSLAKSQSTKCCQSLITPGSDHPPVLKPHMVLTVLDEQGLLIHLTNDLLMSSVFLHKLEARVLHEHDPLILLNRHSRT